MTHVLGSERRNECRTPGHGRTVQKRAEKHVERQEEKDSKKHRGKKKIV
jgi:hypothetical protein